MALRGWRAWLPVAVWAGVIFYLSSIPSLKITEGLWDFYLRKAAHITVFAVLTLLSFRAVENTTDWTKRRRVLWTVTGCLLYAMSDEWHQTFVPGRVGCWPDVTIDAIGIFTVAGFRMNK